MEIMKVTVSAPGKVTLFGEHAIVYGKPALVSAIDRRIYVSAEERSDRSIKVSAMDLHIPGLILTFKEGSDDFVLETDYSRITDAMCYVRKAIEVSSKYVDKRKGVNVVVRSEMPVGAGLGTSAAISVGTVTAYCRLMGHELKPDEIAQLGHATELEAQGAASPMDTAISTYGGTIYIKPAKPKPLIEPLDVGENFQAVLGYTDREARTGDLLKKVRALKDSSPKAFESVINTIGEIVEEAKVAMLKGDKVLMGSLMNMNHGQLESLGVSSRKLNDMVYSARSAGALGSKMTGAGGGGCMIALCPGRINEVTVAIGTVGGEPLQAKLSGTGVRLELVEK
jgi:mevalonate kinase